ncbi:MAG: SCO family protein [Halochromatium sp.]|uniref:SCO family protein n=1 Tax=Halochromatium sp. TaxID=2049430 RepID=UPI00397B064D
MKRRSSRPLLARLIMALAAVGLFLVGYQWGNRFQRDHEAPLRIDGVLVRAPSVLPELNLRGPRGPITNADLRGRWSLLAFGSPGSAAGHRGVARLIEIANRVADQPELHEDLRLLLISADDAPGLARDFEQLMPRLRVLSASRQALGELREALGAGHASASSPEESGATPPPLFLVGPQARLVAVFTGAQPAASVAEDLKTLAARPAALPRSETSPSAAPNASESDASL